MAVESNLGSLIVAIVAITFTFNPQVIQFFKWLHRLLRSFLNPSSTRCNLFLWRDFKPGQLHCHSGAGHGSRCTHCATASTHAESERCWTSTVALAFNNAWDAGGRKKWAKKPEALPLSENFVRTEAKVVLAYFVCTARVKRFAAEQLGSRMDYVELRQEKGLVLAHVGPAQRMLDLTKDELDKILDGWPPFYRKTFTSIEGHLLENPLTSFDQVRRPGWIVAIGLGTVQPTDVFIDAGATPGRRLFEYTIQRVKKVLQDQFLPRWGESATVKAAIKDVEDKTEHGASENAPDWMWKEAGTNTVAYPDAQRLAALTQEQCETLMRVFGQMAISPKDQAIIDPVLDECMTRVTLGVHIALKYTSTDRVLNVPPLLQGDRVIYLRDCKPRDD